ncbi:MAG: pyruvate synthase [Candidatus Methanogaster sp.]|uniref:Pyruvate synthase n=1 Tax=Candidatus Methanogaster sp. TaxID=3386292 RepID=A0AC61L725_9EURY|nr:MAG: pyruvate synthase [ANME-2 cluster archaeon]
MKVIHAAIVKPGTTLVNKTGGWRTFMPECNYELCNGCGICETYCPDSVIVKDGDRYAPNLDYCKGCGICANVCPKDAITMILEGK